MPTLERELSAQRLRRTHERLVLADGVADRNLVMVAFGDSVTAGFMAPGQIDYEHVYHAVFRRWLSERFPLAIISVINAGRGGDGVIHALDRVERDVVSHNPDLVIVCFGLNDCCGGPAYLPAFRHALDKMIDQISACPTADIVLLTPNPIQNQDGDQFCLADYVSEIRDVAHQKHVALADAYLAWQQQLKEGVPAEALLTGGTNRPNARGHLILAETLIRLFGPVAVLSQGR